MAASPDAIAPRSASAGRCLPLCSRKTKMRWSGRFQQSETRTPTSAAAMSGFQRSPSVRRITPTVFKRSEVSEMAA